MKRLFTVLFLCSFLVSPVFLLAGDYDKAWAALLQNDKAGAVTLFQKALKNKDNHDNALAMLIMLEAYEGKQYHTQYGNAFEQFLHPEAYFYSLWFYDAILGNYGKKSGQQLAALNHIADNKDYPGSLAAAAAYFKGMHCIMSQQFEEAGRQFKKIGALESWQFAGPFDNVNGSGFNKAYGPVQEPVSTRGFLSSNNNWVNWFSPSPATNEGWIFVLPMFTQTSAVGYAQTFVYAPADQDALLCLGGYGALKVWVNDQLLLAEEEERRTELDAYQASCRLHKGYNRILVQIGYTADTGIPNFIVRLTDTAYRSLKDISSTATVQDYTIERSPAAPVSHPHFAEAYFLNQLQKKPDDPAYPLLLSKTYLRCQKYDKAKEVLYGLYKKYPENPFIVNSYTECLSPQFENTQIAELVEKVKLLDPQNYWVQVIKEGKLEEEKKYEASLVMINDLIAQNGSNLFLELKKINLLSQQAKVDSAILLLKQLYSANKENADMVSTMALYYKHVLKNPDSVIAILEAFGKDNYNYNLNKFLADEYFEKNNTGKGLQTLKNLIAAAPYLPDSYQPLVQHFFSKQQYDSAIYYLQCMSRISPYNHSPLADIANCYMQQNDTRQALAYYRKALGFYPGGFDYRRRIRELEKKPDLFTCFPEADYYGAIDQQFRKPYDTAYSYYYILEDRNVVVYSEGASEQVYSAAVMINNKNGIDAWKELSIPYNNYFQTVLILKAEVVKADGSRVPAETSGNEIVFAKMEPGDAIYYSYKISNYGSGRLGREFWDKFIFNSTVPARESRYNIMVAEDLPFFFDLKNDAVIKPVEGKKENFHTYSWVMKNLPAIREESYMPARQDIAKVLHLSTVKSWDIIAEWYSDITRTQSREDFELNEAFKRIFPQGVAGLTDKEKARKIYEFIEDNIAYSSVSFRQSAYVPQLAGKTLQTRLGDCKDMSTLFLAFARKAGLAANLMLVNTRNNGLENIALPSMEFNHCIIRYEADNKECFLELTDNLLPFDAFTRSLANAQVLNIPFDYKAGEKVQHLRLNGGSRPAYIRTVNMKVAGNDCTIDATLLSNGELASSVRSDYLHRTLQERKDALQQDLSGQFKNQVLLNSFSFGNLDNLADTVRQELSFRVKNEIISMGDLHMLRPFFMDIVATANIFSSEKRQYPFAYYNYEAADQYHTIVEIELPEGKLFDQVPSDLELGFLTMKYNLRYKRTAPGRLLVERVFKTDCTLQLTAKDFEGMEGFFNKIITAEQKYISYK